MTSSFPAVARYMTRPLIAFPSGMHVDRALAVLLSKNLSSGPVVDEALAGLGVVSRTNILELGRLAATAHQGRALLDVHPVEVDRVMTRGVLTVSSADSVSFAAKMMVSAGIHRVFVAEDEKLIAAFSTKEVLRALFEQRTSTPIEELMSSPVYTVHADETLSSVTDQLADRGIAGLAVVDRGGLIIGTFSQREALESKNEHGSRHVEHFMSPSLLFLDHLTPIFRAAAHVLTMGPRRVVATDNGRAVGILTGIDFARATL